MSYAQQIELLGIEFYNEIEAMKDAMHESEAKLNDLIQKKLDVLQSSLQQVEDAVKLDCQAMQDKIKVVEDRVLKLAEKAAAPEPEANRPVPLTIRKPVAEVEAVQCAKCFGNI